MSSETSWWSDLGNELGGANLERYGQEKVALLCEQGPADVAILGSLGAKERIICVSFAAVQDPQSLRHLLLTDEDFVSALSPYTKKVTRRLRIQAGRVSLLLPRRRDGLEDEPRDLCSLVKALTRVLTRRAPVPSRRCVNCCAGSSNLVLRNDFPQRICENCSKSDEMFSSSNFEKLSPWVKQTARQPKSHNEDALALDELSMDELTSRLEKQEDEYENWLYMGLFGSVGFIFSMALAFLFLLMSHTETLALIIVAFALVLTVAAPIIYAIIFARAHSFLSFRASRPALPLEELSENQRDRLKSWLEVLTKEVDIDIAALTLSKDFECTSTICCHPSSNEKCVHVELGVPFLIALCKPCVEAIVKQQLLRAKLALPNGEQEKQGHLFSLAITYGYIEMWLLSSPFGPLVEPLLRRVGEYLLDYQSHLRSFQRKLTLLADLDAVSLVGSHEYAKALCRGILDGLLIDVALDEWRRHHPSDSEFDKDELLKVLRLSLSSIDEKTQSDLFNILLSDEAQWMDFDPSLKERLSALAVTFDEIPKYEEFEGLPLDVSIFDSELKKMSDLFGPSFSLTKKVRKNGLDWCSDIEEMMGESPKSPALYALLAEANGAACNDEAAARAVRKLVELDESNAYARTRLLSWSLKLGHMGEAAWNVSYLIEHAPQDKPFQWLDHS